jgi:HD-like signal output (HDOD) protein
LRVHLAVTDLENLIPADPATAAHCRRVAALACEVGRQMSLSRRSVDVLEQTALLHHTSPILFAHSSTERLLRAVLPEAKVMHRGATRDDLLIPDAHQAVLCTFHNSIPNAPELGTRRMADILKMTDFLDQEFESRNWDHKPVANVWKELLELRGLIDPEVLSAARNALDAPFRRANPDSWVLPINASVARDVLRCVRNKHDCEIEFLAELAGRDAVLAGKVIQAANSARYSRRAPVRSILEAIAYIGPDDARMLLMALALQQLFASAKLTRLWRHSVRVAAYCEGLARDKNLMEPDEAFLLGLVHDVGRLAIHAQSRAALDAHACLCEHGCPVVQVEQLLFGEDHAEIGARILAVWEFPAEFVEAIRYHHRPADSGSLGAAALYAAEFWSEADEELPSARHLTCALKRMGCQMDSLAKIEGADSPFLKLIRVA